MAYKAPVRDLTFVLNEVLEVERHSNQPGLSDVSSDLIGQILEEGAKFAEQVIAPLNRIGDQEGCKWDAGKVTGPTGWKDAYRQMVEAGWVGLSSEAEHGGQGMPAIVGMAFGQFTAAASPAFSMYPGLTHGCYEALNANGSEEQKALYCPKLATGEWGGTMNLTEPQCGTDLGLIRTKAVPNGDGSYSITGQKIWISSGEHDFTDNIVHLVLARIEGAPAGIKGISLFVVPKFFANEDGTVGERNAGAQCAGLEHKMGIHGNATCVMAYDGAKGWLVGQENKGMAAMFVMMNEARLGTGLQGLAIGTAAYQAAVEFARDRLQGRSLTGTKNPDGPADPIIVHPDVRRMLLEAKAFVEGGQAFILWTALQADLQKSEDEATATKARDYMGLITPVLKAYLTDKGFHVASLAMQVHGGSGYTEHFPASQYLRDARITMIYEGANGIQALDLVGRKLPANGGRAIMTWFGEIDAFVSENGSNEAIKPFVDGLADAKKKLQEATMWLMQNGMANPDNAGAASTDYLNVFGLTAMAYMWAQMAKAAQAKVDAGSDDPFYAGKLATGRYFVERILPDAGAHLAKLKTGADVLMSMPAEAF
ncbi:MAG: acyl-CoA dehydrogenase C-terminal domain-containing protein [Alphaproteobacteria bacterium]|nr:acyl-CoA dehydrogenase C-terminal domain-containing protein [Alphaproteobacteria bacterium]MBU1527412.1 acyl-CoA dehydrogenase C-terminal domain-containing protein [Alphaproteobacteria bacterium]MBU2350795.1 acyl-CoA dehydrogenase C-terminal domain-containing protein [Alphaproteobacteria bacterium]MBU2381156.1 acyl-CoA dehydrogenase C-terminal domain-containing protein [Alphaproteobacteria bacterium]